MSEKMKQLCDCGCGRREYHNKLVVIEVEQAINASLRQTQTTKRFWVTRECKEPYEQELGLMILLEQLVRAWSPQPVRKWWLVNAWLNPFYLWPVYLFYFFRRIHAAHKVMRITHAIHERIKGFDYARTRAINSAVLFGAPRFMQGFLARRFTHRLARAEARRLDAEQVELARERVVSMSG